MCGEGEGVGEMRVCGGSEGVWESEGVGEEVWGEGEACGEGEGVRKVRVRGKVRV